MANVTQTPYDDTLERPPEAPAGTSDASDAQPAQAKPEVSPERTESGTAHASATNESTTNESTANHGDPEDSAGGFNSADATSQDPFAAAPEQVRRALHNRGFSVLTAVQQAVLRAERGDLRITSQTGSGKTIALGLALAQELVDRPRTESQGPVALVIAPTRELAVQVSEELTWLFADLCVEVDVVTGGTDVRREQRRLRRPASVLVGTPGRLLDHIRSGALRLDNTQAVALDEADRMLDMGFRDELDAIVEQLPTPRRSHLVSATFAGPVAAIADKFQHQAVHVEGTQLGTANADIEHVVQLVDRDQRYAALVSGLLLTLGERVLVFVDRRAGASELAELLSEDGFAALPFSGDLSQAQRTRTLAAFRTGTIGVLVCTDVAARGIDVPDIAMVVHMSPPQDPDDYTHRAGRTGRAGRPGRSLLLVPPRGQFYVRRLLRAAGIESSWQPVPSPAKVRKSITKATRRVLHERLIGPTPDASALAYAQALIEERDPAHVIATLLKMAEPRLPREPMAVRAIEPAPAGAEQSSGPRRFDRKRKRPSGNRFRRRR